MKSFIIVLLICLFVTVANAIPMGDQSPRKRERRIMHSGPPLLPTVTIDYLRCTMCELWCEAIGMAFNEDPKADWTVYNATAARFLLYRHYWDDNTDIIHRLEDDQKDNTEPDPFLLKWMHTVTNQDIEHLYTKVVVDVLRNTDTGNTFHTPFCRRMICFRRQGYCRRERAEDIAPDGTEADLHDERFVTFEEQYVSEYLALQKVREEERRVQQEEEKKRNTKKRGEDL
eukprot:PhF_6_TR40961/c0_g1_i1/m.62000